MKAYKKSNTSTTPLFFSCIILFKCKHSKLPPAVILFRVYLLYQAHLQKILSYTGKAFVTLKSQLSVLSPIKERSKRLAGSAQ